MNQTERGVYNMAKARGLLSKYWWFLALVGGVVLYFLYPASLPVLLIGGMMLMHLGGHGGHGGHGHGSHQADSEDSRPLENASAPSVHNHGNYGAALQPNPPKQDEATPVKSYKAGFEAHQHSEPAPEEQSKPHRHRGC